ncbi:MAG: oligogalacturonate lyase [Verrucomicrobia bacterium]|nr:oligogalacturonate lyase [Verrucomicrobiota bacterium]
MKLCAVFFFANFGAALSCVAASPAEWIEPATGHRVVRLSREAGSTSLYFHQNAYTPEGDKLLISTPRGLATVDLKTRELELVVPRGAFSGGGSSGIEVGRRSRQIYFATRGEGGTVIRATHLDTKATRDVVKLPFVASFNGVNADETLVIGTFSERATNSTSRSRSRSFSDRTSSPRAMKFFAADIKTGEVKFFHPSTNWLNHAQCSPADPMLMLFCHEGTWQDVDRVWTVRVGSDDAKLMHPRTMPNEIAGHEFFSRDGAWVWYDLQTPRSKEFWLGGVNVATGERIRYALARGEWSVHYNISPDGKLFAGDGGGPNGVANQTPLPEKKKLNPPGNGQWIYLFRPQPEFKTETIGGEPVKVGRFVAEKLVDLSKHDYSLEPNVTFTPDGKWLVFRGNMGGERHVYAVEVAKAR